MVGQRAGRRRPLRPAAVEDRGDGLDRAVVDGRRVAGTRSQSLSGELGEAGEALGVEVARRASSKSPRPRQRVEDDDDDRLCVGPARRACGPRDADARARRARAARGTATRARIGHAKRSPAALFQPPVELCRDRRLRQPRERGLHVGLGELGVLELAGQVGVVGATGRSGRGRRGRTGSPAPRRPRLAAWASSIDRPDRVGGLGRRDDPLGAGEPHGRLEGARSGVRARLDHARLDQRRTASGRRRGSAGRRRARAAARSRGRACTSASAASCPTVSPKS